MLYCPKAMAFASTDALHDFIEQHPFGCLVSQPFFCSHLPWLLKRQQGEQGVLYGHLARQNPHTTTLDGQQVLINFTGPHAYISPGWYQSKLAVPTWNYAVAHVQGKAQLLEPEETLAVLEEQVAWYESEPAALAKMPAQYREQLAQAIVGIRVPIEQLAGKLKLGQQRSAADQQGVFAALQQSSSPQAQALAALMASWQLGVG
ncbi:FMN-binding negative transcriptional regulator [Alkalimonas sp. MEB108]|uniref:FMN-binding negative transcriptional regulator n=1 Tax=Alkalimonas cellulosilytica TaxID=3058395 RepID=A0ABU7J0U8_9GAMM|nr:FMN-binding negative transcriptional regulator [Alkalimonas sp. MEB108]MEE2000118.1 FMN-binding negative transcriptional regulator [Alkalimonas sp. MEB108]